VNLLSSHAEQAVRVLVKIAIEHPDGVVSTGNVFLKHQGRIPGILHCIVIADQLFGDRVMTIFLRFGVKR